MIDRLPISFAVSWRSLRPRASLVPPSCRNPPSANGSAALRMRSANLCFEQFTRAVKFTRAGEALQNYASRILEERYMIRDAQLLGLLLFRFRENSRHSNSMASRPVLTLAV